MVVKCGDEGTRENACVIRGGDVHVDGTGFFGIDTESVDNFTVSGVTFEGSNKHNVWFSKPGRVVFQDCEFRSSNASLSPVFGDYSTDVEGEELSITFVDSRFSDNVYSSPPAQPALAVGNGFNNRFTFQSCIFTNNIMIGVNDTQVRLLCFSAQCLLIVLDLTFTLFSRRRKALSLKPAVHLL